MKIIQLTQGVIAIVDDEDFERLGSVKWAAGRFGSSRLWYAIGKTRLRRTVFMHREVLRLCKGMQADHIHRDDEYGVIDNRKENIRGVTHSQNQMNSRKQRVSSSRFKGVRPDRRAWRAYIQPGGKFISLGTFDDEIDAACAYDAAARILFGEFAHTNFSYVFVV